MDSITAAAWPPQAAAALHGQGGVMRQVAIKAGAVAARHHHDFEQFLFVVSGHGLLDSETGPIRLDPGTALHLPPGAWHAASFPVDTLLLEFNLGSAAA